MLFCKAVNVCEVEREWLGGGGDACEGGGMGRGGVEKRGGGWRCDFISILQSRVEYGSMRGS